MSGIKSLLNYVPTHIFVLYAAGVIFQFYANFIFPIEILLAIALLCLAGLKWKRFYLYFFCSLVFCIGVISMQTRRTALKGLQLEKQFYVFVIDAVLKANASTNSYYAVVENNQASSIKENILLRVQKDSLTNAFSIGDRILSYSKLSFIPTKINPYDFDYKSYSARKNIYRQVYLSRNQWSKLDDFQFSLKRIAYGYRQRLIEKLAKNIKEKDVLSVSIALLLGERQYISTQLQENYADAGVIHILAVSGLHIGIIVLILHFLLRPLKKNKYGALIEFILMLVFLWSYAFLAGLSASVIRAVTMFSFVSFGLLLNYRSSLYHSIITSALVLVLFNPFYFFDLGFKMSYIAVFSIITFYPMIVKLWQPKNKLIKYLWNITAVSISAQLGLLPLSLYYFHQFPALFIISNLVVLPSLGMVLILGFMMLFLSVFDLACQLCFQGYTLVVDTLNKFISFIANQENWLFDRIYISELMLILLYALLVVLLSVIEKIKLRGIYIIGVFLMILQLVFFWELSQRKQLQELIVYDQYKKTVISTTSNTKVKFYGDLSSKKDRIITNYLEQTGIQLDTISFRVPNIIAFKENYILVVDNNGIYKDVDVDPVIILFRNSPKINLERCLDKVKPKIIIADGSNYPYLKKRWKTTCKKMNVAYYDTSIQGAFVFKP